MKNQLKKDAFLKTLKANALPIKDLTKITGGRHTPAHHVRVHRAH